MRKFKKKNFILKQTKQYLYGNGKVYYNAMHALNILFIFFADVRQAIHNLLPKEKFINILFKTKIFVKSWNSTFPPCIWLLKGFCQELYPYCLFRGHGIVFFVLTKTFQSREWSRACVCGVAPKTTPEAEKSRLEQKWLSQDRGLNIGIQF